MLLYSMYTCGLTVVIKRIRYVMFTGNGPRESVQSGAQSSRVQMKLDYTARRGSRVMPQYRARRSSVRRRLRDRVTDAIASHCVS